MCACGYHESLTNDSANVFMPEFRVCNVCRGGIRYVRSQSQNDDEYKERHASNPSAPELSDGRSLNMRLLSGTEADELKNRQPQSRAGRPS